MSGTAFLVLGMHRSGTSAVARLLNLAGAAISDRLMPPQADNPKGFWESQPISELHDQVLARMGLAWDSIERVPDDWFASPEAETMRAAVHDQVRADFPDGQSFVVKDPRVCRFVPAWLEALAALQYTTVAIMPVRNPLEVAQSLARRNGFPVAKSLLLWLRHVLDAEAATREVPRALIDYSGLLDDWRAELADANRQLGFTCFALSMFFEEQVARFLSPDDRHHVASADALKEADRFGWAAEAFAVLRRVRRPADTADLRAALATLDRVKGVLDGAEAVMDPFLAAYRSQVHQLTSARATADVRLAALDAQVTDAQRRYQEELDESRAAAQHAVEALRTQVEEQDQALTHLKADLERTRSALSARSEQLSAAQHRARTLDDRLAVEVSAAARLGARYEEERDARARAHAEAEALRTDRQQLRRSREQSERALLRTAAVGHATIRRSVAHLGRLEGLLRLLLDADVRPSQWIAAPLRSARSLIRLRRREYRRRVTLLARSGLFDREYYGRCIPDVSANLPARFLVSGDVAGERPHLLFDPEWYRRSNPDIPHTVPALQHYLMAGGWDLRSPHPLFDPAFYLSQWMPADADGVSPLSHFLEVGGAAGVSPHPLFDAFHYLRARPNVAAEGMNPLLHYLTAPASEVADPHPLFSNEYYLARNPDVERISALEHFVRHGAAEGRSPHPLFDVGYYWHQRPDVEAAGVNALDHFLRFGAAEGVDPHPLFSCRYYVSQCGADWDPGANPLVHYLRWGRQDSHCPHPGFDSRRYLESNPDVASSGVDPLVHYVLHGACEGRPRFDERASMSKGAYRRPARPDPAVDTVVTALDERIHTMADRLHAQGAQLASVMTQRIDEVHHAIRGIVQAQATSTELDALGRQWFGQGGVRGTDRAAAFYAAAAPWLADLEQAFGRVPPPFTRAPRSSAALVLWCACHAAAAGEETIAALLDHVAGIVGRGALAPGVARARPSVEPGSTLIVLGSPVRAGGMMLAEVAQHLVAAGRTLDLYARAPLSRGEAAPWLRQASFRAVRLVPDSDFTAADLGEWTGRRAQGFEVVHGLGPMPVELMQSAVTLGRRVVYETGGHDTRHYLREFEQQMHEPDGATLDRTALALIRAWSAEQLAIRHAHVVLTPDPDTATFVSRVFGPTHDPVCTGVSACNVREDVVGPEWRVESYGRQVISAYGATGIRDLPAVR